jgi:hypothetical protein
MKSYIIMFVRACNKIYYDQNNTKLECHVCNIMAVRADIGRIYIKGYLYTISYPKIAKKVIPLSFF